MDSWTVPTYNLMDQGIPLISGIYFSTLIIFGSFCLLNLLLASIMDSFIGIRETELKKDMEKEFKKYKENFSTTFKADSSLINGQDGPGDLSTLRDKSARYFEMKEDTEEGLD